MSPDELYLAGYRLEFSGSAGDLPEIERLYRRAAAAGSVEAMARVGLLVEGRTHAKFRSSRGSSVDLAEAGEWYRRGAHYGDANAAFFLGRLYEEKLGDRTAAEPWYRQAARGGSGDARKRLAEDRLGATSRARPGGSLRHRASNGGCAVLAVLPLLLALVVLVTKVA
ncbi:hypothetical protein [Amycolatopsis sp. NPDC051128]|uniref:tetratricopeptide repeat protein n=1 Tax=Amycolatopsis sp. NPDC051128 TaxID=3155412 RepID=UPI00341B211E